MVDRLVNSEVNARRIESVESCFGSSGQPLAAEHRVLVGEGILTKMCRKKPKPRQFFLFNDILVYGNIVINKRKYNCQRVMPLEEVQLVDLEDEADCRNGWIIRTRTKSFAVYAATQAEKFEWMAHIKKCVDDLLSKSGKQGPTDHAAVWVPDTDAKRCMCCQLSQFSLINRRHHCRNCGKVVCAPCSNKKFVLPGQSTKALRVCTMCYRELSDKKPQTDQTSSGHANVTPSRSAVSLDSSADSDGSDEEAGAGASVDQRFINQDSAQFYSGDVSAGGCAAAAGSFNPNSV